MTTRKPPHDPHEPERRSETMAPLESTAIALMEGKIAELESAVAEAKDRYLHTALDHKPRGVDESWVKGLELSVRKLEEALSAHGLEPIQAVGVPFDPKLHEAIGYEESAEHAEDTVTSELRRGYRIRDRVVRPALVKVARPPELTAPDGEPNN